MRSDPSDIYQQRRYGRPFAIAYLVALPTFLIGLVAAFATQSGIAVATAVCGAVVLVVLANVLARWVQVNDPNGRPISQRELSGYHSNWYRLVFGLELAASWRVLRHPAEIPGDPSNRPRSSPKSREL